MTGRERIPDIAVDNPGPCFYNDLTSFRAKKKENMLKADDHKKEIQAPGERSAPSRVSHLGPSLKMNGEITGTDNIVVEGVFEGRIRLEGHDVLVESGGRVKADLAVRNVTIRGALEGNIQASGIVLIEANGRMSGDISAARISVMEGAQFKGGVKITRT